MCYWWRSSHRRQVSWVFHSTKRKNYFFTVRCVLHRQHLVAKRLSPCLQKSLGVAVKAINKIKANAKNDQIFRQLCVVVVIIPPLSPDGGMARTAIQVHAVNLIEIRLGKRWQPISTGSPTTNNKAGCHWWVPKSCLLRHAMLATLQL